MACAVTTGGSAIEVNAQGINIDQGVVASKARCRTETRARLYQMGGEGRSHQRRGPR